MYYFRLKPRVSAETRAILFWADRFTQPTCSSASPHINATQNKHECLSFYKERGKKRFFKPSVQIMHISFPHQLKSSWTKRTEITEEDAVERVCNAEDMITRRRLWPVFEEKGMAIWRMPGLTESDMKSERATMASRVQRGQPDDLTSAHINLTLGSNFTVLGHHKRGNKGLQVGGDMSPHVRIQWTPWLWGWGCRN